MSICRATKRNGEPCTLPSTGQSGLCWAHDPANAEKRRRGQSRGGKNKPSKELAGIKAAIRTTIDGVLDGSVDRARGAVSFQGFNALLKCVEVERKVRETDDLLARLEELEAERGNPAQNGGRTWLR